VPFAIGARLRRLEAEGWIAVGAWFPWRYLKRPLAEPLAEASERLGAEAPSGA